MQKTAQSDVFTLITNNVNLSKQCLTAVTYTKFDDIFSICIAYQNTRREKENVKIGANARANANTPI